MITFNLDGEPRVDETSRFPEPKDLLAICSSLLKVDESDDDQGEQSSVIRLAHFSVKEYLVSERIRDQVTAGFCLQEISSHVIIASCCLAYLLTVDHSNPKMYHEIMQEKPLL